MNHKIHHNYEPKSYCLHFGSILYEDISERNGNVSINGYGVRLVSFEPVREILSYSLPGKWRNIKFLSR